MSYYKVCHDRPDKRRWNRQLASQWQPDSSRISATWAFLLPPHSTPLTPQKEVSYRHRAEDGPPCCPPRAPFLLGVQLHQVLRTGCTWQKKMMASVFRDVPHRWYHFILVLFRFLAARWPHHPQLQTRRACLLIFWPNSDHMVVSHLGIKIWFFSTFHISLLLSHSTFLICFSIIFLLSIT